MTQQQSLTVNRPAATDTPTPRVVGVYDLSDVVLASLSSSAAPVLEAPAAAATVATIADAPAVVAVVAKPAKPPSTTVEVAYVHVPDCIACHACEDACPSKAIEVADFSIIDPNICEACNECVPVCPTNCISLQPRASYATLEFAVKK